MFMKIKIDYVTNSSSTNFIIISKKTINSASELADLLGIREDSPIYDYIYSFCEELIWHQDKEFLSITNGAERNKYIKKEFGEKALNKYIFLTQKGYNTFVSSASTGFNDLMSFFALDYFEIDLKDIYINGENDAY